MNVTDLLALLAAFGSSADGDTNSDGETNVTDLLALLAAFGQSSCTPGGAGSGCLTADVTQITVSGAGASEWDGVYIRQVDDRHPADGARAPPIPFSSISTKRPVDLTHCAAHRRFQASRS